MTDPKPVPRVHPLARKDDVQALWDAAALAAISGSGSMEEIKQRSTLFSSRADHVAEFACDVADAFIKERARRMKEPTND